MDRMIEQYMDVQNDRTVQGWMDRMTEQYTDGQNDKTIYGWMDGWDRIG